MSTRTMGSDLLADGPADRLVRVARTATGDSLRSVTSDGLTIRDFAAVANAVSTVLEDRTG